jgi:hypothetical protein
MLSPQVGYVLNMLSKQYIKFLEMSNLKSHDFQPLDLLLLTCTGKNADYQNILVYYLKGWKFWIVMSISLLFSANHMCVQSMASISMDAEVRGKYNYNICIITCTCTQQSVGNSLWSVLCCLCILNFRDIHFMCFALLFYYKIC